MKYLAIVGLLSLGALPVACGSSNRHRTVQRDDPDGSDASHNFTGGAGGALTGSGGRTDGGGGGKAAGGAITTGGAATSGGASSTGGADANAPDPTGGAAGSVAADASTTDGGDASRDAGSCGAPILVPTGASEPPPPVARWSGEDNTDDRVGGRNGVATAIAYGPGVEGRAFVLNGSTSDVVVPDGPIGSTARNFSVVAWVNPVAAATGVQQKAFVAGTSIGEFHLGLSPTGTPFFGVHVIGPELFALPTSPCPAPVNAWTFLVGVRRGTTAEIWVDGALWATTPVPDGDLFTTTNTVSAIGAYHISGVAAREVFRGSLDEVRLFDAALSGEQIAALYGAEAP